MRCLYISAMERAFSIIAVRICHRLHISSTRFVIRFTNIFGLVSTGRTSYIWQLKEYNIFNNIFKPGHSIARNKRSKDISEFIWGNREHSGRMGQYCIWGSSDIVRVWHVHVLPYLGRISVYIDGLVHGGRDSCELAMELHVSCINPSIRPKISVCYISVPK